MTASDHLLSSLPYHNQGIKESLFATTKPYRTLCFPAGNKILSFILALISCVSWMFPRSLRPASNKKPHELHSTAYLDALRGYAAFVVYNSHVIPESWRPENGILRITFLKIWFHGHGMVDVFFVISGYALSYRMLDYIHTKQHIKFLDSLASSTLRRYLRLFVPTAVASFVCMIVLSTGLAVKGEDPQVLQPTFWGNLQFWIADTVQASSPFPHVVGWWYGGCFGTKYLPQMWTIPVEFRGSVILFMFLAATCKMATRIRLCLTCVCAAMFFWWEAQWAGEFLIGMWIADLKMWKSRQQQGQTTSSTPLPLTMLSSSSKMIADSTSTDQTPQGPARSPSPTATTPTRSTTLIQQIPYIILFICSLTPLTGPMLIGTYSEFPFNLIAIFMPPNYDQGAHIHYPLAIGAIMLVYSLDNAPLLQKPLLLPVSQFVGELSFGIYAMHNTIRWIVWEKLFVKWGEAYWGPAAHEFWHVLPGYLVMTVLIVWSAELFRRMDMRVVAWTRELQDMCFERD